MSEQIIILVISAVLIGCISLLCIFWEKWMPKRKPRSELTRTPLEDESKEFERPTEAPAFVRLYDSLTRIVENTEIDGLAVSYMKKEYGGLGRTWNVDGRELHCINKYQLKSGALVHYRPVEKIMKATREHPPGDVHEALCQPEIAIAFDVSETQGFFQSVLFKVLVWIAIMTFIIFMWSQSL